MSFYKVVINIGSFGPEEDNRIFTSQIYWFECHMNLNGTDLMNKIKERLLISPLCVYSETLENSEMVKIEIIPIDRCPSNINPIILYDSKINDMERDLKKLANYSDLARQFLQEGKCEMITLKDFDTPFVDEEFSFHPNGKCGCIKLPDDYMFGIRCDHLMWAEGEVEYYPTEDNDVVTECILIYGNHKGYFRMNLLIWHNEKLRKEREDEIGK